MRAVSFRSWFLSAMSAFLLLLPFPLMGPVPLWRRAFCWVALVPLLWALEAKDRRGRVLSPWQGASVGYLAGVLWFAGNCYWVYQAMHTYGLPELVSGLIVLPFCLYLGLYFALFGAVFVWLRRVTGSLISLLLMPLLWVAVEMARSRVTGFPWDLLGYTQVDNRLLIGVAPVAGVMGLSLLVAGVNALWLWPGKVWGVRPAWLAAGFVVVVTVLGYSLDARRPLGTPAEGRGQRAVLLQDNLSVGADRSPESREAMFASFASLSLHPMMAPSHGEERWTPEDAAAAPPAVILWPEAPTEFFAGDPVFRRELGGLARQSGAAVISDSVSMQDEDGRAAPHVSASFFTPDGRYAGRYDKIHLVPFGEYVPYHELFFFAGHLLDGLDFVPGKTRGLFETGGRRYGVFICYESIFGDEVREFVKNGADVLVNLSDDGWYGDTSAPWEHLDMARMRAIENHRWLLRDTNTGLTAAIGPDGVVHEAFPRHVRMAGVVHYEPLREVTFYTVHGDWIGWMSVGVVAAGALGGMARRRRAIA